jgi:hypothetical protein
LTVEFMSLIFYQNLFTPFDGEVHVAHLLPRVWLKMSDKNFTIKRGEHNLVKVLSMIDECIYLRNNENILVIWERFPHIDWRSLKKTKTNTQCHKYERHYRQYNNSVSQCS